MADPIYNIYNKYIHSAPFKGIPIRSRNTETGLSGIALSGIFVSQ